MSLLESIESAVTTWPEDLTQLYRQRGYWRGDCLGLLLERSANRYPERTALIEGKRSINYRQLHCRAQQLAVGLAARGIGHGDRVVVQLPNSIAFFELLFALFTVGAVPVMALATHRRHEIEHFCRLATAKAYVVAGRRPAFDYLKLAEQIRDLNLVEQILIDSDELTPESGFCTLASCYDNGDDSHSEVDNIIHPQLKATELALLQLSGGTSNLSKLIPRSHDDYYYSIRASAEICELSAQDVYLAALPVAHNFPLSSPGALGVLHVGGCVVLAQSGAPDACFELIERYRVTVAALVPPLAISWLNTISYQREALAKLSSLRLLQVGGAKLSRTIAERLYHELPGTLQQVFGMAEGLVNYTGLHDDKETIISTQGRPISEADEIKVVNACDEEVANGQFGQLLTRGPYTIRGYFAAPQYNQQAFTTDGFYRTGDEVRLTDKGYLIVEGRIKDQINRGGEKIAAEEIENILLAHDAVKDCALVAMPDDYLGERSCAFVIFREGVRTSIKSLRSFLRQRQLADFKIPDRFEFVERFPVTKFGKVNKQVLRQQIAEKLEAVCSSSL